MAVPSSAPTPPLSRYRQLSLWAVVALVALRLVVGWHFFMEGSTKVREGGFTSVGFLGAAKGPLADTFHDMVPDFDGQLRLDADYMKGHFDRFIASVRNRVTLSDDQIKRVDQALEDAKTGLQAIYDQWKPQLTEYREGFQRQSDMAADPKRSGVASLRRQRDEIETKWRGLAKPVLGSVDKLGQGLASRVESILSAEQLAATGELHMPAPGDGAISVSTIDKIIPIFDMVVGILLILGLLTPVAAIAAGIFLASVVLTQFPGAYGAQPTYYQAIEMVACFVLAFADAGRYAGLDFIPWAFWNRAR